MAESANPISKLKQIKNLYDTLKAIGGLIVMAAGAAISVWSLWAALDTTLRFTFVSGAILAVLGAAYVVWVFGSQIKALRADFDANRKDRESERATLRRSVLTVLESMGVKIWEGRLQPNEARTFAEGHVEHAAAVLRFIQEDTDLASRLESDLDSSDLKRQI